MKNDMHNTFSSFNRASIPIAVYEIISMEHNNHRAAIIYSNSSFLEEMKLSDGEFYWENNNEYSKLGINEVLKQCKHQIIMDGIPQKFYKIVKNGEKHYLILASRYMQEYIQVTVIEDSFSIINEKKQRLYRAVINNARDIILLMDQKGNITNANRRALSEYGYTYDEFKTLNIFDLRNPRSRKFSEEQFRTAIIEGIEFETLHYRKDGSSFRVEVKSVGIELDNDKYVTSIIRNIEVRRKIEEEKMALAAIVESSEDAILAEDTDGIIMNWNKGAERLYGYAKDEVIGKHISIISPDEDKDDTTDVINKILNGNIVEDYETHRKKKNGEIALVSITASPIFDSDRNIIGISAIARDITDKQRLITELNKSEEKYRTLYYAMTQGVALHEIIVNDENVPVDYRYLDMNESFQRLLNIRAVDYIGKTARELLPNIEEYWIEKYGRVALTGEPVNFEEYSKDFNRYFNVYAFSPIPGQFAVLVTDVTKQRLEEMRKSIIDELTGVYNRRYINERLPLDINSSNIDIYPLVVIMADIDYLKDINDRYGHLAGDTIIQEFSSIIKNSIKRDSDWVARYGGDEFIIILNNSNVDDAYWFAENIREQVKNKIFVHDGMNIKVTSSFGIYPCENGNWSAEFLLREVDKRLYEAKRKGRNRTIMDNNAKMNSIQLSMLNKKIEELRDNLNDFCESKEEMLDETQRLRLSEYLDRLIVEYMKNIE